MCKERSLRETFTMLVVVLALIAVQCDGFMTPRGASILPVEKKLSSPPKTTMNLSDADLPAAANDARRLFSLWFFGGSGGGGIAIAAFPQMYSRFMGTRGLKGQGPTLGGDKLGISPLCGLPEDLSVADVEKILRNKKSVETMVEKGPKDSFWAEKGYLRFEAFQAANPKCNPLALRAIFDALTTSTSTVEPDVAQELLDEFREDTATFKKTLLLTKAKGYSAIAFLLFLLGLTATVSAESLAAGWFPDWPGNNNFPIGLVNPGIWTIPDYWI